MMSTIKIVMTCAAVGCYVAAAFGGGWALFTCGTSLVTTACFVLPDDDDDEDDGSLTEAE